MTLAISYFRAAVVRYAVNGEKTQVVRRELVFHARIAQPDNQFHALSIRPAPSSSHVGTAALGCPVEQSSTVCQPWPSYFFSFFSGFSGFSGAASAPPSPSPSCLPFLLLLAPAGTAPTSAATNSP